MHTWRLEWAAWQRITPAVLRERLALGADPDARLHALGNTPLFEVLARDGAAEMIDALAAAGATIDVLNLTGQTPLWEAVRIGRRDSVRALLRAGADPWRPLFAQWSPGLLGMCGPLADLFEDLPGAPRLGPNLREMLEYADILIESYASWQGHRAVGFVAGVAEEDVLSRLGALRGERAGEEPAGPGYEAVHVATSPYGGVVLHQDDGAALVVERCCRALTTPTGLLASVSAGPGGGTYVHVWRDGRRVRHVEPGQEPGAEGPIEEWLCHFGDLSGDYGRMERALAYMSMITGVAAEERWTREAPHHRVLVPR
ncbi:hypothetical protein HNP84_000970 [Thermocatellispora tengchongensis]|uniref:Ankyrin repeat domain-containing protein n=1 Tax=Thermocatellispora tengchongensis TaxID=1073253 RepID=A0A840NRK3_9ACTN|nr:ankyrin repeat domain-containing protein [Thermocatellispora tengchongensis]MBB5131264.1 hypothetical protein [Thermocatellispora tengchongensis]